MTSGLLQRSVCMAGCICAFLLPNLPLCNEHMTRLTHGASNMQGATLPWLHQALLPLCSACAAASSNLCHFLKPINQLNVLACRTATCPL
jgi:hypothetical protein